MTVLKRKIKDKRELRRKLITFDYRLDKETFNNKNKGEIWSRKAKFIIKKCDFNWEFLRANTNIFVCDCKAFNKKSKKLFTAQILAKSEEKHRIQYEIQNHLGFIIYEGSAICKLLDFEYYLFIFIHPKIGEFFLEIKDFDPTAYNNLNKENNDDLTSNLNCLFDESDIDYDFDEYDWARESFDALTDGQYGDYDDFDGDWDSLNDWRGG
jgi:hypothetical protein